MNRTRPVDFLTDPDVIGILFISSSVYGAYFVLFIISSFILHRQVTLTKRNSSGTLGTTVHLALGYLSFFIITLSWILSWVALSKPKVIKLDKPGRWSFLLFIQNAIGCGSAMVAESILAFRLYIIWERRKVVLWAAVVVFLGYLAVSIYEWVFFLRTRVVSRDGIKTIVMISLSVNIIATSAIIWGLWRRTRLSRALGGWKILFKMVAILIESAALYTIWMVVYLVLYFINLDQSHLLLYGSFCIAGLSTTLVNVRVGLGWAAGEEGRLTRSLHESAFVDPDAASAEEP
ncbi:hypothetical protein P691DRAFT_803912 [Macrolepiota fuliginosa MF-IS2]|uniref:Uncharacterized protein n=1 Tax=Macrolepiota fuliginosa MF-IS2 TaxID=1400762 RepID=A0A9P5XAT9_9AGAR|nr:hypothetical protein P691DRAFT_803912 [Macrolepiota fuliginosa MF-IS2]